MRPESQELSAICPGRFRLDSVLAVKRGNRPILRSSLSVLQLGVLDIDGSCFFNVSGGDLFIYLFIF